MHCWLLEEHQLYDAQNFCVLMMLALVMASPICIEAQSLRTEDKLDEEWASFASVEAEMPRRRFVRCFWHHNYILCCIFHDILFHGIKSGTKYHNIGINPPFLWLRIDWSAH